MRPPMTQLPRTAHVFEIEGTTVSCHESDGHYLWRCECEDFERRLSRHGEGFCAHTAAALMRHLTVDGCLKA